MKVVILAGGFGTRISEESHLRPKPMIEIGNMPMLWHIMKTYSNYGLNEFIICLGYKGYMIKEYFANYFLHLSDVTIDIANNNIDIHRSNAENWKITLVDTGVGTQTGGRIKRIHKYLANDKVFCLTYGDGVTNVNINELIQYHESQNKLATLTAVQPPGRYGSINIDNDKVESFKEKQRGDGGWISGGYFVVSTKAIDYITDDTTIWEKEPLEELANSDNLAAFKHSGFWYAMDTLRDKIYLNDLWEKNEAPWRVWES
ncbi:MAG: glucose-1-phosphate cytidylyltransferase [Pseudomonadota bacterium]